MTPSENRKAICLQEDPKEVLEDYVFQKGVKNNEHDRCCMFPLSLSARGSQIKKTFEKEMICMSITELYSVC